MRTFIKNFLIALIAGLVAPAAFAKAPQDKCAIVGGEGYWFCRSVKEERCGLAQTRDDAKLCKIITEEAPCDLVQGDANLRCKGITEKNCDLVPEDDREACDALTTG